VREQKDARPRVDALTAPTSNTNGCTYYAMLSTAVSINLCKPGACIATGLLATYLACQLNYIIMMQRALQDN
jgi:hypothetical protein